MLTKICALLGLMLAGTGEGCPWLDQQAAARRNLKANQLPYEEVFEPGDPPPGNGAFRNPFGLTRVSRKSGATIVDLIADMSEKMGGEPLCYWSFQGLPPPQKNFTGVENDFPGYERLGSAAVEEMSSFLGNGIVVFAALTPGEAAFEPLCTSGFTKYCDERYSESYLKYATAIVAIQITPGNKEDVKQFMTTWRSEPAFHKKNIDWAFNGGGGEGGSFNAGWGFGGNLVAKVVKCSDMGRDFYNKSYTTLFDETTNHTWADLALNDWMSLESLVTSDTLDSMIDVCDEYGICGACIPCGACVDDKISSFCPNCWVIQGGGSCLNTEATQNCAGCFAAAPTSTPAPTNSTATGKQFSNDGLMSLEWTVNQTHFEAEIKCALTRGWCAWGINDAPATMVGADIVWILMTAANTIMVKDARSDSFSRPILDTTDNLVIESADITSEGAVVRYSRALNTGDSSQDTIIRIGTQQYLLWAHKNEDISTYTATSYHGNSRGYIPVIFTSPSSCPDACSANGYCDRASNTCTCNPRYEGNGTVCTLQATVSGSVSFPGDVATLNTPAFTTSLTEQIANNCGVDPAQVDLVFATTNRPGTVTISYTIYVAATTTTSSVTLRSVASAMANTTALTRAINAALTAASLSSPITESEVTTVVNPSPSSSPSPSASFHGDHTHEEVSKEDGLSDGAIAGIVIGSLCGAALLVVSLIFVRTKKSQPKSDKKPPYYFDQKATKSAVQI